MFISYAQHLTPKSAMDTSNHGRYVVLHVEFSEVIPR